MTISVRMPLALAAALACGAAQILPDPALSRPFSPDQRDAPAYGGEQYAAFAQGGGRRPSGGAQRSRPAGGGHHAAASRPQVRSGASTNINHNVDRNRNRNVNRNVNRDVNRDVNVNVHNDYHGGGYYHDDWDDWDDHWHPVATMAVAATTAAVVGSIVRSVPPSCTTTVVNGISYSQCGNTWYQPQYVGSSVQYVVVNPPR
ncbi:MAG: DUF6515 family protein [Pseudomonadota bacterium]|nr:hypothetical protein [Sphingobium sp.]MCC4252733.1 hypothetical protein [Sphingobium naphthae]MEC7934194.1 DUF6515 family protein [Pseudomonadota bacterium]MEC8034358.1 DUF6515 family protein [Pseudomonadota bacterium]